MFVKLVLITLFSVTIASNNQSFWNQKSRPLLIAARQREPFTYYDDDRGFYKGIDYMIVQTIAERLQLNVKFVRIENDSVIE